MSGSFRGSTTGSSGGGVLAALMLIGLAMVSAGLAVPSGAESGATAARTTTRSDNTNTSLSLDRSLVVRPGPVLERRGRTMPNDGIEVALSGTEAPGPVTTSATALRDRVAGVVLPESDPVDVAVPALRLRSDLVRLGLTPDGAMETPANPAEAGWFTRGAAPGALGPAVIAGHVTWNGSPGVFHRLRRLKAGDQVLVGRKDGHTAVFTVERVARYSKSQFPTRDVFGAIDHAGLRLITCGGAYDTVQHRYPDNVVVFARQTSIRRG
ncbi:hypothetical protein GCM10022204_08850 [Microlunatus aurantiacus]|uniref:Sortase family protein n=1 Tax=Microlunatus aurantiacus TaxID=446786 RepID=A0ABP7CVK8_9ACTN